jgi:hypothetical protein
MSKRGIFSVYRDQMRDLLPERGVKGSRSYQAKFSYETLAAVGTAAQMAVGGRLIEAGDPFGSIDELRAGASQMILPPDGESMVVSRNLLETLVAQPSLVDGRLGVNLAAANRTLGWAMSARHLVGITALMPITRTLEQKHLRREQTLGVRTDGRLDLAAIVGISPDNGGAAFLHATHPHFQDAEDEPAHLVEYHQRRTGIELDPLLIRLTYLRAVWAELEEMGISVPIVQRAERRFDQPQEGSETAEQRWFGAEQPHWSREVDGVFPADAVVLGERSIDGLVGFTYRTRFGSRKLGNPAAFLREVELRLDSLHISDLRMSSAQAEARLEGADDLVCLEGQLIDREDYAYRAVIAIPSPHSHCAVYLIPSERAAAMSRDQWDAVRAALAPIHGISSGRSSDDQGLGLLLPRKHGLSCGSSDIDKSTNYESLRCFGHAIAESSHWRSPDLGPGGGVGEDDAEAA